MIIFNKKEKLGGEGVEAYLNLDPPLRKFPSTSSGSSDESPAIASRGFEEEEQESEKYNNKSKIDPSEVNPFIYKTNRPITTLMC